MSNGHAGGAGDTRIAGGDGVAGERRAVRALVAGHGDFAAGMVSAVDTITGRGGDLEPVSVAGLCAEDIEQRLLTRAEVLGARVIFTDLPAGSCTIAVRRLLRSHPELVLVTGANLATLVDFVLSGELPPAEAAQHAADRGRGSISVVGGPA